MEVLMHTLLCLLVIGIVALPAIFKLPMVYKESRDREGADAFMTAMMYLLFRGIIVFILITVSVIILAKLEDGDYYIENSLFYAVLTLVGGGIVTFFAATIALLLGKFSKSSQPKTAASMEILDDDF